MVALGRKMGPSTAPAPEKTFQKQISTKFVIRLETKKPNYIDRYIVYAFLAEADNRKVFTNVSRRVFRTKNNGGKAACFPRVLGVKHKKLFVTTAQFTRQYNISEDER